MVVALIEMARLFRHTLWSGVSDFLRFTAADSKKVFFQTKKRVKAQLTFHRSSRHRSSSRPRPK